MSWLSIPLPNPFKSLQITDDDDQIQHSDHSSPRSGPISTNSPRDGVRDDLSAIGESITRQLRGVAAFLAPPPLYGENSGTDVSSGDGSKAIEGIRSDLAEIGGGLKNSLSIFSGNSAVAGFSKLASSFLQLNDGADGAGKGDGDDDVDDDDGDSVGVTDEVVEFANRISNRPELWTDFPLPLDDKEFDLSDAQAEHASVIEQLVPDLADLRSKLAGDMSDNHFWMIYFILLLPRLDDDDFELLSTPEIVEAREHLLQMLDNKKGTDTNSENTRSPILERNQSEERVLYENSTTLGTENKESEEKVVNKSASNDHSQSGASSDVAGTKTADNSNIRTPNKDPENDVNNWSGDEQAVTATSQGASKQFQSEDDVSFSDLEVEDDDEDRPSRQTSSGMAQLSRPSSSPEGSSDWIQLNKDGATKGSQKRDQSNSRDRDSEGYESSDWLTVDDFDP